MSLCFTAQAGAWERVLEFLEQVQRQKIEADGVVYTHSISACATGSSRLLRERSCKRSFAFRMGGCFVTTVFDSKQCLVLERLEICDDSIDSILLFIYYSLHFITVSIYFLLRRGLEFHWSSAITACADASQWQRALALAPAMRKAPGLDLKTLSPGGLASRGGDLHCRKPHTM